jgi:hypothetical protein
MFTIIGEHQCKCQEGYRHHHSHIKPGQTVEAQQANMAILKEARTVSGLGDYFLESEMLIWHFLC